MYLDPGLGSMIVQIAIAALATAGAALVFLKNRFFGLLGKKKDSDESAELIQPETAESDGELKHE